MIVDKMLQNHVDSGAILGNSAKITGSQGCG